MSQYVALVQQGMILDQKVVAYGPDQESVLAQAEQAATLLNSAETGFGEAWTAVALEVQ
jgi:hypothetical protein